MPDRSFLGWPFLGATMEVGGHVFVDRGRHKEAVRAIDEAARQALYFARDRIEAFHRTQLHEPTSYVDGGTIRSFAVPVDRAGCYVPGGRAAYPSTVLMTAIPAKVAGVGQVVVCVPPDRTTGAIVDVTLAACAVAGVDEVYAIGGAQAIGALAYGTESVAKVDVICGPGNKYVAIAKREVAEVVGIASGGNQLVDNGIFLPLEPLRWMADVDDGATELLIYGDDKTDGKALAAE